MKGETMIKNNLNALIIFVDIRGFTVWSGRVDNVAFLDDFIERWYKILICKFWGD